MSIASVADLLDALCASRLLEPAQRASLGGSLPAGLDDPRAVARDLVKRGVLTPNQVNQVFLGRGHELTLGSYLLLERLGEGGMGQVFKARHRRLDRTVALKLIRKERLATPQAVQRFQREARAAARLSHPHIATLYDADEIGGTHFLSMEYIEGTDLSRLVKERGPLPAELACEYVRQAALGLQNAHEQGMVHRDVKPHNLLLGARTGVVKVLAMGLARLEQEEDSATSPLTREGTVMGTPDYIAPEQALDSHTVDIRADVYSLGCTLYFLLTGRPPFPGGTLAEKLTRHLHAEPAPVGSLRPGLPVELVQVLLRMMAKKREQRYPTPGDVAAALAPFCPGGLLTAGAVGAARQGALEATVAWVPSAGASPATVAAAQALPVAAAVSETVAPDAAESVLNAARPGQSHQAGAVLCQVTVTSLRGLHRFGRFLVRHPRLAAGGAGCLLVLALLICVFSGSGNQSPQETELSSPLFGLDRAKIPPLELFKWQPQELVAVLGEHRVRSTAAITCVAVSPDGELIAFGCYGEGDVH
jgi:serine/threonine-protein kinase